MDEAIFSTINDYFTNTITSFGATARGVDWNSETAQEIRFTELIKLLPAHRKFSLNDYGCGYGALLSHLRENKFEVDYKGLDCVEAMIDEAKKTHAGEPDCHFICDKNFSTVSDYTVASGVFNARGNISNSEWTEYVCDSLRKISQISSLGFGFNMLTKYSDAERMRADLYYADPCFFFDFCKRNFARNVALLHDYGQYEFTMLVRKDTI